MQEGDHDATTAVGAAAGDPVGEAAGGTAAGGASAAGDAAADPAAGTGAAGPATAGPATGETGAQMANPGAGAPSPGTDAVDAQLAAGEAAVADGYAGRAAAALGEAAELIAAGGPVVAILLAMSVFALAVVLAKTVQFAGAGLAERRAADRALALHAAGRRREALAEAEAGRGPAARALAVALDGRLAGRDEARLREAATLAAADLLEGLRGWLRPLEVIAALAPLLGLLGTVLGMITAFAELEAAGSRVDPAVLSGGIWEALLTTAVGIAVAIPAVVAFNWFERRIERAETLADHALSAFFSADVPPADLAVAREPETRHAHRLHARSAAGE